MRWGAPPSILARDMRWCLIELPEVLSEDWGGVQLLVANRGLQEPVAVAQEVRIRAQYKRIGEVLLLPIGPRQLPAQVPRVALCGAALTPGCTRSAGDGGWPAEHEVQLGD